LCRSLKRGEGAALPTVTDGQLLHLRKEQLFLMNENQKLLEKVQSSHLTLFLCVCIALPNFDCRIDMKLRTDYVVFQIENVVQVQELQELVSGEKVSFFAQYAFSKSSEVAIF
jgi:hypothetical protein